MNAILKYPGAKWRIAKWIIEHIPEHHSYVEPYFGSGAVFFNKSTSNIETINDLDEDIINFFRVIRDSPDELAYKIQMMPYSRAEYERSWSCSEQKSSIEKALAFCVKINMSHGYKCNAKNGWKNDVQGRERAYAVQVWNKLPEVIVQAAKRLKEAQIEQRSALDVINRFNNPKCLIYCDPPYLLNTRSGKQYNIEMTDKDHEDLLYVLLNSKSKIMISGYESDLYNRLLKQWRRIEKENMTQSLRKRKEILWMNF